MKISIILPVYQSSPFLEGVFTSLIEQQFTNWECIVVEDGSTDDSREVINDWAQKDSRFKIFELGERKGVGVARNFGLDQATGDYVYFLDCDDYISPHALEVLSQNIGENNFLRGKTKVFKKSFTIGELPEEIIVRELVPGKKFPVKRLSTTNILMKRQWILDQHLRFQEGVLYYSTYPFLLPMYDSVDVIPTLNVVTYFKRSRKAATNPDSLTAGSKVKKIHDFCSIYEVMSQKYPGDSGVKVYLDNLWLIRYRRTFYSYLNEPNELTLSERVDEVFMPIHRTSKKVEFSNVMVKQSALVKRALAAVRSGDKNKLIDVLESQQKLQRIKKKAIARKNFFFQKDIRKSGIVRYLVLLAYRLFCLLPAKKNTVVFESFLGRQYSCNPRAMYEYMTQEYASFDMYWSIDPAYMKNFEGRNLKTVRRFSVKWFWLMARSKYWVFNSRTPVWLPKAKHTTYVQTWHGTPLKRLGADIETVHMPGTNTEKYKENFFKESSKWDYLISPNRYSTEIFQRAFNFYKDVMETGYPRNDILLNGNNPTTVQAYKTRMGIPIDKKVILYAPTWRDNQFYGRGKYRFDLQMDLSRLQEEFGDEYIVVLRLHYLVAENLDISDYEGFVYDYSNYEDIRELYLVSDICITDYSSVFFDYGNLDRPMIFFCYDIEEYRDSLRGFYFDFEATAPGPIVKTNDELIDSIKRIDKEGRNEEEQKRYNDFYNKFCYLEDGQASKKCVEKMIRGNA